MTVVVGSAPQTWCIWFKWCLCGEFYTAIGANFMTWDLGQAPVVGAIHFAYNKYKLMIIKVQHKQQ